MPVTRFTQQQCHATALYETPAGRTHDKLSGFYRQRNDTLLTSNVRSIEPQDVSLGFVAAANPRREFTIKSHLPLKRDKTRYRIK